MPNSSSILFIDRVSMLTNAFVSMLMKQGFSVHVAAEASAVETMFSTHVVSTVIVAMDTDGIDGFSEYAGAFIKPETLVAARKVGLNPDFMLANNDSYNFFKELEVKKHSVKKQSNPAVHNFLI